MEKGQVVEITDFMGHKLRRMVVEVIGNTVLVCKEDEFKIASRRRKLPWVMGFPKDKVRTVA